MATVRIAGGVTVDDIVGTIRRRAEEKRQRARAAQAGLTGPGRPGAVVKHRGIEAIARFWIAEWERVDPSEVARYRTGMAIQRARVASTRGWTPSKEMQAAVCFPQFVLAGIGRPPPLGVGDSAWYVNDPQAFDAVLKLMPEAKMVGGSGCARGS